MEPTRVLVVDDSAFMRKMLTEIISGDSRFEVVATARNGLDGLQKIKDYHPDVVTLDVEMPVMDGITALKKIMETMPLPVVMLSSLTGRGTVKTIEAVSSGAVDFITKPSGPISLDIDRIEQEILTKVFEAANSNISFSPIASVASKVNTNSWHGQKKTVIGIGASTGGPRALQQVLTSLPANFPAPVLIVQHMPAGFTKSLADRLNSLADIHIKEAEHGEILQRGTAYIAPGNQHMKVINVGTALSIELNSDIQRKGHRPSVDILFESIADLNRVRKVAIVLTGMGSDGAEGIIRLKTSDHNSHIIAEAEQSAVVYGMPKAAVNTDHVNQIIPMQQVGQVLTGIVNS
ncbi:chemotaxis response regulator protein-glutamate methylesterase [Virgibacillus kekensis]|uniref:Protein-glutamate methylesterase/protein-glutamine glutaminase n=1 Tax=Virgibacillus kekensis TaxID=202261 RepID=A0ABV9DFH6_9BACI